MISVDCRGFSGIVEGFMSAIEPEKSRYFVYVLRNPAGLHYIGLSEDPLRRLEQHNSGSSRWTRNRGPWVIIWTRGGMTLAEARKLESELKKQKGGDGFYKLTGLERVELQLPCAESLG